MRNVKPKMRNGSFPWARANASTASLSISNCELRAKVVLAPNFIIPRTPPPRAVRSVGLITAPDRQMRRDDREPIGIVQRQMGNADAAVVDGQRFGDLFGVGDNRLARQPHIFLTAGRP